MSPKNKHLHNSPFVLRCVSQAVSFGTRFALLGAISISLLMPSVASADVFGFFKSLFGKDSSASTEDRFASSQNIDLLQAVANPDPKAARGGGDITVVGGSALLSEDGPSGTALDVEEKTEQGHISIYVVREGDNLSTIAKMFGVTKNTIIWANDIKGTIRPGQTLVILPISGVRHTVAKGDTVKSIAKKYKADIDEIMQYNGLEIDQSLTVGEVVIVPDGEVATPPTPAKTTSSKNPYRGGAGPKIEGFYMRPVAGGIRTQGIHGYNGVDLANYYGAPVMAAAPGVVIVSKSSGWNGGYGQYIVIKHDNGTQTLYAHLSRNTVSSGEAVAQGQVIGYIGNTGKSSGPHLHFEVRGAVNPF